MYTYLLPAVQHRVATDAPVAAFKIMPILWESSCHLSSSSPPGARLNAVRWAAVAWEQVFVWVRFAVLRVCSARRAVIQGEPPRALLANRRSEISIGPFCIVRRSFVATDSGSPTPRCNRHPCRGVQDQADFSESLCHVSCSSSPGSRLNAIRWAACGLWIAFVWVPFAILRVCSARWAVI